MNQSEFTGPNVNNVFLHKDKQRYSNVKIK